MCLALDIHWHTLGHWHTQVFLLMSRQCTGLLPMPKKKQRARRHVMEQHCRVYMILILVNVRSITQFSHCLPIPSPLHSSGCT